MKHYKAPMDVPYAELPQAFKDALCFGTDERAIEITWGDSVKRTKITKPFEGLVAQMERLYEHDGERIHKKQDSRIHGSRRCLLGVRWARGSKPEILGVTIRETARRRAN